MPRCGICDDDNPEKDQRKPGFGFYMDREGYTQYTCHLLEHLVMGQREILNTLKSKDKP